MLSLILAILTFQSPMVGLSECPAEIEGFYNPITNKIFICDHSEYRIHTLAHEAVHYVQDYLDGIENNTFRPILTNEQYASARQTARGQQIFKLVNEAYYDSDEIKRLEFEAFWFQNSLANILMEN